jgi:MOSC domain-containing protein YiiM
VGRGATADVTALARGATWWNAHVSSVREVCVGGAGTIDAPRGPMRTAIDKRPVRGRVAVGPLGLAGDRQVDKRHHGGPDKAVYAYAEEDVAHWAVELGRDLPPGSFGENLRTSGVDVTNAVVGERWRVGGDDGVVVEVTQPRIPCATFQAWLGEPRWVKRFTAHGAPGAYLRVVQEGTVAADDAVELVHRPAHGVSIGRCLVRFDAEAGRRLLAVGASGEVELADSLVHYARRAVGRR